MIDPNQEFPTTNLAKRVLGVQVVPKTGKTRLVVLGNAMFASDEFLRRSPENLGFALNAVDWLAQDEALMSIRSKDRSPPPLLFSSNGLRDAVKYFNLVGLPLLIAAYGALRLVRRRRQAAEPYRPLATKGVS
jgi:ABC-type uncharacterized transport system involved in gliding motility auxiliary subunit